VLQLLAGNVLDLNGRDNTRNLAGDLNHADSKLLRSL